MISVSNGTFLFSFVRSFFFRRDHFYFFWPGGDERTISSSMISLPTKGVPSGGGGSLFLSFGVHSFVQLLNAP
jgi:hypothetical protein